MANWIAILLASVGAGLGMLFPSAWFLALLGLSSFFFLIWFRAKRVRIAALWGFLFGFATGGAGVWWMWDMLPLATNGALSETSQFIIVLSVWGVTALLAGLSVALIAVPAYVLRANVFIVIITATLWTLGEEIRMWLFALFSWSPESLIGPHFSQTAIGYVLTENDFLRQFAAYGGIQALNFAAASIAGIVALLTRAITRIETTRQGIAALLVLAIVTAGGISAGAKPERSVAPMRVAVIGVQDTNDPGKAIAALSSLAEAKETADLIVFPEGEDFTVTDEALRGIFNGKETLVISTRHVQDKGVQSELSYQHSLKGTLASYRKIFLMPQGEYLPWAAHPLFALTGDPTVPEKIRMTGNRFAPGDELRAVTYKGNTIGGLICSDSISPYLYAGLAKRFGANVLVNTSNPAWFHGSKSFHHKMLQISRMHAAGTRSYFIAASVGSPSFVLDPRGNTIAESVWNTDDTIFTTIGSNHSRIP